MNTVWQTQAGVRAVRDHSRKAFTLIELLVVVAIIAVLAALVLPSLIKVRDRGKTVVCMNNMRQLGILFNLYAADNNYWLPHYAQEGGVGWPSIGEWFMMYKDYLTTAVPLAGGPRNIYELGKVHKIFDCPATQVIPGEGICYCGPDAPGWSMWDKPKSFDYFMGYAYQDNGLNGKKITKLRPDTILLIDYKADQSWNSGAGIWLAYDAGTGYNPYQPGFHHNNGANILFPNGRIEWHTRLDYHRFNGPGPWYMKEYLSQW